MSTEENTPKTKTQKAGPSQKGVTRIKAARFVKPIRFSNLKESFFINTDRREHSSVEMTLVQSKGCLKLYDPTRDFGKRELLIPLANIVEMAVED